MAEWWENDPLAQDEDTIIAPTDGSEYFWAQDDIVEEGPKVPPAPTEPVVAPENAVDDRGVPGGPTYVPKVEQDISLDRYQDMKPEEALVDYQKLKDDPASGRTWTGEVTINNQVVPYPEIMTSPTGETIQPTTGIGQMVANSARGAIKNTIVSAAAVIDEMAKNDGGYLKAAGIDPDFKLAEKADKAIANRATGNGVEEVLMQAGEYAAGAVAGYKLGNPSSKGLSAGGNFSKDNALRYFARALGSFGSMVGAAASSNPATETGIVGDNAMVGDSLKGTIFAGVPVDKNGAFSEQILAKKLNIVIDEMTFGLAARAGQAASQKAWQIGKFLTYDQIKPLLSKGSREDEAVDMLMGALEVDDVDAVRKYVQEYSDVWMELGSDKHAFQMNRTVLSAMNEGFKKEGNSLAGARAMQIESTLSNTNSPRLNQRLDAPLSEFQRFQADEFANKGGIKTVNHATDTLMDSGVKEVTDARLNVTNQNQAVRTAEEDTRELLRNDPNMGDQVKRGEAAPNLAINNFKSEAQEKVMEGLKGAATGINSKVDELYSKIPEGIPIDEDSFIDVMKAAKDFVPKPVKDLIRDETTTLDFKTINNQILPQINEAIGDYARVGNRSAKELLEDVRKNIIETQTDFVGGDAAKIAEEARKYFREVKVPFRDSDAVGPLFDKRVNDYNMTDELQAVTEKIADSKMGTSKAVIDLIKRPEYTGDKKALFDVYTGDLVNQWSRKLNTEGGIDNLNPDDIVNAFGASGVQLKKEFPDKIQEYENLVAKLNGAKGNIKQQKLILDQVKEKTKKVEEEVFNVALRGFLKDMPDGTIQRTQNAYQEFKTMLNSEKNGNWVDEIVKRVKASGDPVAEKGLKSAYVGYLKERLGETAKGFSEKNAKRLIDEPALSSLAKYGYKIFGDEKEVNDYIEIVRAYAKETDKRVPEGLALTSKGVPNFRERGRTAADLAITMTYGKLDKTGSQLRSLSSMFINLSKSDKDREKIFDLMLSDKNYFDSLVKRWDDRRKSVYTDEAKSVMWKLMTAAGVYNYDDQKVFDQTWDEAKKSKLQKETDALLKQKDK